MTRFFVDESGVYLGGFDGSDPPEGSIEVPEPPQDGRQIWNGSAWTDPVASTDSQITSAPEDLFGGPTLGEIFNGNA